MLLHDCPGSPNCAQSYKKDGIFVSPLIVSEDPVKRKEAWMKLKMIIKSMPRATLINETDNYLKFEFRSKFFEFVDDVEFLLDEDENHIHMRSASRSGYYDFGVNKRRLEKITAEFIQRSD